MADARLPHRPGQPQGIPRLLLLHTRLLRRESRDGNGGRSGRLRGRSAPPRHEGAARLGGQPHGPRRALDRREAGRLVRTRRAGRAGRPLGLDRHGQTRLRQPRRMAGPDRRHALLARGARRRRIPLRHGDARPHRFLARSGAAAAAHEARPVHAGRGRGAEPLRGRDVRRLLRLANAPPAERRGAAEGARHGAARLPPRRPRPLSPQRHAAVVHVEPRRELVERLGVRPHGRRAVCR